MSIVGTPAGDQLRSLRPWLPPIRRREFWLVQGLVLAIAGGHALLELLKPTVEPPALYLLPTSLYFVPVVYAALNFGLRGSVATAAWSALLTLPNTLLFHTGLERVGEAWQMAIVLAVAVFVGQRVDRERTAREQAEDREAQRRVSESRYRALFDNAAEAVLLLDVQGVIVEANPSAAQLLGSPLSRLRGATLAELVGAETCRALVNGNGGQVIPMGGDGERRWVESVAVAPSVVADEAVVAQLMLHDITIQHERQRDLEAYARQVLAAREEEQRRIGRELHDGPLQSLVLLWRKLDAADAGPAAQREAALEEARGLAGGTADELRRISRALRPSILDDLGLAAALKSEVNALGRRTSIVTRFAQAGDELRLEPEVELTLLRVLQEALHNIERHAGARRATVHLAWGRDEVRLSVRDNGRGLDSLPSVSDLLDSGRLGLAGIQERVRLAGGTVALRSRPGEGTTVEVAIPALAAPWQQPSSP